MLLVRRMLANWLADRDGGFPDYIERKPFIYYVQIMEYVLSSKDIWLVGMINFMMKKAFFIMLFLLNGIGSPFPSKLALAMCAERDQASF